MFSNKCIEIVNDEGTLAAASLTVFGFVVLFIVYREGKDGKSLNHIGCCNRGSFFAKIKHTILSTYYFIISICSLILINGFRKHDYAAKYIYD